MVGANIQTVLIRLGAFDLGAEVVAGGRGDGCVCRCGVGGIVGWWW